APQSARRVGGVDELRARLTERYREPHRRYHDVRHLQEVLASVDELAEYADDQEEVRWAAWFHDAVYDVRRDDNEEQSARLAVSELTGLGRTAAFVDEVARLVRLTLDHRPADDDTPGQLLCDADLAILAAPAERYAEYAATVREEYEHLSDEEFRVGRTQVLERLMEKESLFSTPFARISWESAARANISAEMETLTI
ncbi:MAG: HD domain-containing protein, partial [Actinomycetes bacterium]